MTCKDCIHYEACKSLFQHYGDELAVEALETDGRCDEFEDKSLYIKLPCKIGDSIYRCGREEIWEWQIAFAEIFPDETYLIDDRDNLFGVEEIGKTVFLTREEAEAALKEMEK